MEGRNFFQPLFNASICGATGITNSFTLSDSGTSLAFCDSEFMKEVGIGPAGEWNGVIKTIYHEELVSTSFFHLDLKLTNRKLFRLLALGTTDIGSLRKYHPNIIIFSHLVTNVHFVTI
jgi:hypothetical protein